MDALNLIHNAIIINTKQDRSRLLLLHEKKLLRLIISNFGCVLPKNKTHYTIKCPIRIRSFLGASATSTTVIGRDSICSVCGRSFILCNHKAGNKYGDKVAKIISRPGEFLDVSLVSAPRDPLGGDIILHLPRSFFDKDFSQEDLKKAEEEGTYCHYCPANNRQVDELTYDKFVNMQKSAHKQSSNLSPDDIYITTFLGNEGDFDFSTVIDKPLVKFTSNDRYVHLPTPAFHWKKSYDYLVPDL